MNDDPHLPLPPEHPHPEEIADAQHLRNRLAHPSSLENTPAIVATTPDGLQVMLDAVRRLEEEPHDA